MRKAIFYAALLPQTFAAPNQQTQAKAIQVPKGKSGHVLRGDLVGFSVEPGGVDAYVSSSLMRNLLNSIRTVSGRSTPIRIGGTTADEITVVPHVGTPTGFNSSVQGSPAGNNGIEYIQLEPRWFTTWPSYFPDGTDWTYTLNFGNTTNNWENARKEATGILQALGSQFTNFELGNEVDHFIGRGVRGPEWGTVQYTQQYRALRQLIKDLDEYKSAKSRPKFLAAGFVDPPEWPDQQLEQDDFSVPNLTQKAGLVNNDGSISYYSLHLYPQSTCSSLRHLSLDTLSNHLVLYSNVSQYIPAQLAATAAGAPLILGETNSASCGGRSGISDTFGAALWTVDYALLAASLGIEQVYFHVGQQSEYSAFTPLPYTYMNESLSAGVRANFYGHLFLAHVLAGTSTVSRSIELIPSTNSSDLSGYAIREGTKLSKLVFVDMGVWNSSQGISNPSTLKAYDSHSVSKGARPSRILDIQTEWPQGTKVTAIYLQGPGTNAKSLVSVSGQTVDFASGKLSGKLTSRAYRIGTGGHVRVPLQRAEAILLQTS